MENPTLAQVLFKDKQVLVERPEGMGFAEYKYLRSVQGRILKHLFRTKPDRKIAQKMPIRKGYNFHGL